MTPLPASVQIFPSCTSASEAAAKAAAQIIRNAVNSRGRARIVVGTGNSQLEMIEFLTAAQDIDWSRVEAFHLDEYVGIDAQHPASFRRWIRTRLSERVRPKVTRFLEGDAADLDFMPLGTRCRGPGLRRHWRERAYRLRRPARCRFP